MLTASLGDGLLKRGMEQVGPVDLHHLGLLWHALFNPYVASGIVLLIGFFASYMTALSFADLTFVMLSISRWAGIVLIVCGVGFIAGGPSRTDLDHVEALDIMDSGVGR